MSDKFFEALDKAGIVDAALTHAKDLRHMLELRETQLANCTRVMREAAMEIRAKWVGASWEGTPDDLAAIADRLMDARAGK